MPLAKITLAKGRSLEQKRKLAKEVTAAMAKALDVKPEWVTVLIEEYDRENWATAGQLHSDLYGKGFGRSGTKGTKGTKVTKKK
jgi:4-oxalocrotonate tautomerase